MDLQVVKRNLISRGFNVSIFENTDRAKEYLNGQIHNTTVGLGGSVSLKEMGIFEMLNKHNQVWWHNDKGQVEKYGAFAIREKAIDTEVYISSVNGMSQQGQLINIDATGNRIAATAFGHKKVFYVIGINKIEDSFEKAMWRARNISAPKNAQRLNCKTPCAIKGDKCYDCKGPGRICRGFLITEYPMLGQETEILLINENLGY